MRRANTIPLILLVVLLIGLSLGLAGLFNLRFRSGDVYPPYSSLRADPLGTRAFHDALAELSGTAVTRNYRSLGELESARSGTLMYLGLSPTARGDLPVEELRALESWVRAGRRLVVSWAGFGETWIQQTRPRGGAATNAPPMKAGPGGPTAPGGGDKSPEGEARLDEPPGTAVSMELRWGFELKAVGTRVESNREPARLTGEVGEEWELPDQLVVRGTWAFEGVAPEWRSLYRMGEDPVVLERAMGAGTVVLCADGYALSNEALRKHRQSGWLAWLVGESDRVVFDERHLGVEEQTGVVTLARRYRLHGLGIGLLMLAGLWAWRSMMPLVPRSDPPSADSGGAVVAGRDATIGLRNLLERHVPRAELLGVCLDAWRKSFPTDARRLVERGDQMTTVVVRERDRPAREQNLVGAYRELCELANPRQGRARRSETESNYTDEHRHT